MYLEYNEFIDMGGSESLEEDVFTRLEAKARAHLDRLTFERLKHAKVISDAVKFCMFDLINAVEAEEANGAAVYGREIAAMSNDGVSVSFSTSGKAASRYTAIVRTWLAMETDAFGVPLMYPGVCVT